MVSQCANPSCGRPLHYLTGGRLYRFELRPTRARSAGPSVRKRVSVYFWICERCCDTLSLELDPEHGVVLRKSWEKGTSRRLSCEACAEGNTSLHTEPHND
jgi:hypothetical protein